MIPIKMAFEKYLRSVYGRCFLDFVLPLLEYYSAVWCSAAIYTLNHWTVRFLTVGVFECDIVRRRSAAVLCMLYKIRCSPMHPLYGTLHVPYVPVLVTRGALVAHRYTHAYPRCRTSHYFRTIIPLSVSCP